MVWWLEVNHNNDTLISESDYGFDYSNIHMTIHSLTFFTVYAFFDRFYRRRSFAIRASIWPNVSHTLLLRRSLRPQGVPTGTALTDALRAADDDGRWMVCGVAADGVGDG